MPAAVQAARPAPARGPAAEPQQTNWFNQILRYVALYIGIQVVSSFLLKPDSPLGKLIGRNAPGPSSGGDLSKEVPVPQQGQPVEEGSATALWSQNDLMTCSVYLSTGGRDAATLPSHTFEPVKYGDWSWSQTWETEFQVPAVRVLRLYALLSVRLFIVLC